MGIKKSNAAKKPDPLSAVRNADEYRSGIYLFRMESEIILKGGKLQPQPLGHCFLRLFELLDGKIGKEIPNIELRMSALPSAMKLSTHCKMVVLQSFNVDHIVPCKLLSEKRARAQELIMRTIPKLYDDEDVRIATDGMLEYQGLIGSSASHAMGKRFNLKYCPNSVKELVIRKGKFYTESRIMRNSTGSSAVVVTDSSGGAVVEQL
jgi:hypothetical protein